MPAKTHTIVKPELFCPKCNAPAYAILESHNVIVQEQRMWVRNWYELTTERKIDKDKITTIRLCAVCKTPLLCR